MEVSVLAEVCVVSVDRSGIFACAIMVERFAFVCALNGQCWNILGTYFEASGGDARNLWADLTSALSLHPRDPIQSTLHHKYPLTLLKR